MAPVKLNSVPSLYVAVDKSMSRYKLGAQRFACLHIVGLTRRSIQNCERYCKKKEITDLLQALLAGTDLLSGAPPNSLDTDERKERRKMM